MINAIACFLSLASCVPVVPTDRPAVLIVVSRGSVQMQEFSTHFACGKAIAYIKIDAGPAVTANCVAR